MHDLPTAVTGQRTAAPRPFLTAIEWRAIATWLDLSARQRDIAQGMLDGAKEAVIAEQLGLSVHAIHYDVRRMYRKLGVHNRAELITRCFEAYVTLSSRTGQDGAAACPAHGSGGDVPCVGDT